MNETLEALGMLAFGMGCWAVAFIWMAYRAAAGLPRFFLWCLSGPVGWAILGVLFWRGHALYKRRRASTSNRVKELEDALNELNA